MYGTFKISRLVFSAREYLVVRKNHRNIITWVTTQEYDGTVVMSNYITAIPASFLAHATTNTCVIHKSCPIAMSLWYCMYV